MFFNFDIDIHTQYSEKDEGLLLLRSENTAEWSQSAVIHNSHRSWCGLVIPVCRGGVHLAAQLQQRGPALLHTGGEVVVHLHLKEFGQRPIQRTPSFTFTAMMLATRLESEAAGLDSISSGAAWSKCGLPKTSKSKVCDL